MLISISASPNDDIKTLIMAVTRAHEASGIQLPLKLSRHASFRVSYKIAEGSQQIIGVLGHVPIILGFKYPAEKLNVVYIKYGRNELRLPSTTSHTIPAALHLLNDAYNSDVGNAKIHYLPLRKQTVRG